MYRCPNFSSLLTYRNKHFDFQLSEFLPFECYKVQSLFFYWVSLPKKFQHVIEQCLHAPQNCPSDGWPPLELFLQSPVGPWNQLHAPSVGVYPLQALGHFVPQLHQIMWSPDWDHKRHSMHGNKRDMMRLWYTLVVSGYFFQAVPWFATSALNPTHPRYGK